MKIVILGHKGMLGTDLAEACRAAGHEVVGLDLPEFDITVYSDVHDKIPAGDWIINCVGYTDVDAAQSHQKEAFAINANGARHVAKACFGRKLKLMHISTDYVFDGRHATPYTEQDYPAPLSVYGLSKFAGEKSIREEGGHYVVVRTQSLFGIHGRNFVKAVLARLKEGEGLRVVTDQVSAPTYTRHLCQALLRILPIQEKGLVHVAASGQCSWHEFAQAIVDRVSPGTHVEPVTSEEFNRPAPRPEYSVLRSVNLARWTGFTMPSWQHGLDEYLKEEGY